MLSSFLRTIAKFRQKLYNEHAKVVLRLRIIFSSNCSNIRKDIIMLGSVNNNDYSFSQLENAIASSKVSEAITLYTNKNSNSSNNTLRVSKNNDKDNQDSVQDGNVIKFKDKTKTDKVKEEVKEDQDVLKTFKKDSN